MKKIFFFFSILLCLAACRQQSINADFIAQSKPIMPVRMNADTMHIMMTDYVPVLFAEGKKTWVETMDLIDEGRITAISYSDKSGSFAIPVLPNKPVMQSLISNSYENDKLCVAFFDGFQNPHFAAYIQNMPLDENLWSANEDGTWTLDLSAAKMSEFNDRVMTNTCSMISYCPWRMEKSSQIPLN